MAHFNNIQHHLITADTQQSNKLIFVPENVACTNLRQYR